MKPFNLEAALAGAPVCTRDGREVAQLKEYELIQGKRLVGVLSGTLMIWLPDGRDTGKFDSQWDLFMAPTKKTGWVARYEAYISELYGSEEELKMFAPNALSYHKIEWEE